MKILFHISSLYGGGAERVVSNLVNHNISIGNNVILVVCYEKENEYFVSSNVKKYIIGKKNIIFQSISLRKIIINEKPDICIGFMQGGNFRLSFASLFLKNKYILSVRNDPNKEYPSFFSKVIAKSIFNKSNGIVFQTKEAMNWFSKCIKLKSKIIYNPVDESFFANKPSDNPNGIFASGRLVEQKNYPLLINAFKMICNQIDDDLFILGDGPLLLEMKELTKSLDIEDRVHFLGRCKDVKETIAHAKVFAMSSDFEGMPNALLEAYCLLIPCISTDCPCGGPKEIFYKNSGILVPVKNVNEFSKSLLYLIKSENKRLELINGELINRKRFLPKNVLNEWDEYIESKVRI